jgi:hypothetical protein
MINFILFIAGKFEDPNSRDFFARLGLILFMLLIEIKKLNGSQRGGVKIIRNNVVMDVQVNELQPGDNILENINAGAQFGNQVANVGNRLYDQTLIQLQAPQVMSIQENERLLNIQRSNDELQLKIMNENLNLQLEVQEGRRALVKGEVTWKDSRNQATVSMTAGTCCAVCLNVCGKITINAGDNCQDIMNKVFVNANDLCKKGVDAMPSAGDVVPSAVPAFFKFVYGVGAVVDKNVKEGIEWITPGLNNNTIPGNEANITMTDLMNEPDINLTYEKQMTCFEMIWTNMNQKMEESKEIMGRTDVQCGICCCIGVYTVLNYAA